MAEQGDWQKPNGPSADRFAWLPVALILGAILVLIAIGAIMSAH